MHSDRSLRILVAEDNEFNMEVVKTMLTQMGHSVECAWNGSEAIEKLFGLNGAPLEHPNPHPTPNPHPEPDPGPGPDQASRSRSR